MSERGVCKAVVYDEGIEANLYESKYFLSNKTLSSVDRDYLASPDYLISEYPECEGEWSTFLYRDERFSGVAYSFVGDCCECERLYKDGSFVAKACWYGSGQISEVVSFEEGLSQGFGWFPTGLLSRLELVARNSFRVKLEFTEKGKVRSINIKNGYFDAISKIKHKLKFHFVKDKSFAANLAADSFLCMIGTDVEDRVLASLQSSDGLKDVEAITFMNTSLTEKSIMNLAKEIKLKKLCIEDKRRGLQPILREFKRIRPDCFVELNRKEINISHR